MWRWSARLFRLRMYKRQNPNIRLFHVFSKQRNTLSAAGSSLSPSFLLEGEDLPFWQHIIQTLALIEFVSCCWDSTIHEPSTPRSCFILASPSLPNVMPLGFHSTINLLLGMEMSRSWWGNPPLAWADHFFSAISPQWAWQSYHACPVKWSWCNPNGTGAGGGRGPLFGFSECVGLGPSRLKAFCFLSMLACDSG